MYLRKEGSRKIVDCNATETNISTKKKPTAVEYKNCFSWTKKSKAYLPYM